MVKDAFSSPLVVSVEDVSLWGCPHCGFSSATLEVSARGGIVHVCGECGVQYIALDAKWKDSGSYAGDILYPAVREHPRKGIPRHGDAGRQPAEESEYFRSLGLGVDADLGCFYCEIAPMAGVYLENISGIVDSVEAGERIVAMFSARSGGARLNAQGQNSESVHVLIGACSDHVLQLAVLHRQCQDGHINEERIDTALQQQNF